MRGTSWLTVQLRACVNDTASSMAEHSMVDTVLLTEKWLVVLAIFDVVYLHGVITL